MGSDLQVLLMHEVPHQGSTEELAREIRERIPDVELTVADSYEESREAIRDTDVVITRELPRALIEEAENLRWIQAMNAGVDSYPLEYIAERNIVFTNASGVHAQPVAEQVLGYMLAFERNLLQGIRQQRNREWSHYRGGELNGQTLGIIGLGEIGSRIAELGSGIGMEVLGTKRDSDETVSGVDRVYGTEDISEVVGQADYLVLACPLTDDTRKLLGPKEFASMPSDAILVNIARGEVVSEDALVTAVKKGKIGGAALDVQRTEPLSRDSELWSLSNAIVTPHMAGSTPNYLPRVADIFAENYDACTTEADGSFVNRIC